MADYNKEEQGFNISDTLSRTEYFVENNKRNLSIVLGGIALVVGGYFTYKALVIAPQEKEAQAQMFVAERNFEQDSLKTAIAGFQSVIDDYGMTKAANLSHYYIGMSYLKQGKYQEAIDALKDYDAGDHVTGILATGAIGDAYMELGQTDDAISYYQKASGKDDNKYTSPLFMMKAGLAYESVSKYSEALDLYTKIKKDYLDSNEGRDIDKYISRAESLNSK